MAMVLLVVLAADEEVYTGPSEEDVIVLDKDNLESTIYESEDTWLLDLYAPWVVHSLFSVVIVRLCDLNGPSSPLLSRVSPRSPSSMLR